VLSASAQYLWPRVSAVPDTQQFPALLPPEPPRRGRGRILLLFVAVAVVSALVSVLVTVVVIGQVGGGQAPTTPTAAPDATPRNTADPIRPGGRSTLDPNVRSDTEAAVRGNWPLVAHDEFDGTTLDESVWNTYTGRTTADVGRHDPNNISVGGGTMTITSHGKSSAGMAWQPGQQYGRWEVRAKTQQGNGYSAVILLWPDAEDFPEGGEIDFMEIPDGQRNESHFVLHYGQDNSQDGTTTAGDFTQWHNYAVEWAPDHVAGFIDGQEIFRSSDPVAIPPRPMHLAIQQDPGPFGNGWAPGPDETTPAQVQLQVDWVRIYGL
jgi:beta-glucanase (GH16 family)